MPANPRTRSIDSASSARMAISLKRRYRLGAIQISAIANRHRSSSGQRQRALATRCAPGPALAIGVSAVTLVISAGGDASEQALRPEDQTCDHDRVDDEAADRRHIIFAGDIGD